MWSRVSLAVLLCLICGLCLSGDGRSTTAAGSPIAASLELQADATLSGLQEFSTVTIPTGVTLTASSDLELVSTGEISILGNLTAAPGVAVTIRSATSIIIDGAIQAGRGISSADDPTISSIPGLRGGNGGSIFIAAPMITGRGQIHAGDGAVGTAGGDGGDGGSVFMFGAISSAPDTVLTIFGGRAGDGGYGIAEYSSGVGGDGGAGGDAVMNPDGNGPPGNPGSDVSYTSCAGGGAPGFSCALRHGGAGTAGANAVGGDGGRGGDGIVGGNGGNGGRGGHAQAQCGGKGGNGAFCTTGGGNGGDGGHGGAATGGDGGDGGHGGAACGTSQAGNGGTGGSGGNAQSGNGGNGGSGGNSSASPGGNGGRGGDILTAISGSGGNGGNGGNGDIASQAGVGGAGGVRGTPTLGAVGAGGTAGTGSPNGTSGQPGQSDFSFYGNDGVAGINGAASGCDCYVLRVFTGAAGDELGKSVSGAGDVDGDGFDDVIVGAPSNEAGGRSAGRAYVYSGQTGTLLRTMTGTVDDLLGYSVSGAGDVNNDGYDDVIVGAPFNSFYGGSGTGRAYVYSGQNGATLRVFTGEAAYDRFGRSVAGAGDVNNDGYADVIVAAPENDAGGTLAGRAYVYSGQTGATVWTFTGEAVGDDFGLSVSGAGDVNNDGYDDVIVGAPHDEGVTVYPGRAYVYSGQTGAILWTFTGEGPGHSFGFSVSDVGDVNDDGHDDVIVSAPSYPAPNNVSGRAYIYSGRTGSILRTYTAGTGDAFFGVSASGAGDVNNDGYPDAIVGSQWADAGGPAAGSAYIYSGHTGAIGGTLTGTAGDVLGHSVSSAGDVDNNGYEDIIIGAFSSDAGGDDAGRAYVFSCPPRPCACDCPGDPGGPCDGFTDILDVAQVVNAAFRNYPPMLDPNGYCPYQTSDVNCSGDPEVLDVVRMVNVAFRNANPAAEFCNPCP